MVVPLSFIDVVGEFAVSTDDDWSTDFAPFLKSNTPDWQTAVLDELSSEREELKQYEREAASVWVFVIEKKVYEIFRQKKG